MLYTIVKNIIHFLFVLLGLKVEGAQNQIKQGPVIVAANHVSNWDPIVVAISLHRPINFMAKAELFNNFFWGKILTKLNAFPVKRGTPDRQAIRHALEILEEDQVLGIFPEGERKKTGSSSSVHAGIAMLALKSGSPVLPVACIGTDRRLPIGWFRPLIVRVGRPLNLEAYQGEKITSANMEEVGQKIMHEINALLSK